VIILFEDQMKYVGKAMLPPLSRWVTRPETVSLVDDQGFPNPDGAACEGVELARRAFEVGEKVALVVDLSAESEQQNPDKSCGYEVIRGIALKLTSLPGQGSHIPPREPGMHTPEEVALVRSAVVRLYADRRVLVLVHSKFEISPDMIKKYWYLESREYDLRNGKSFHSVRGSGRDPSIPGWESTGFTHDVGRPVVHATLKMSHDAIVLPMVAKWTTTPLEKGERNCSQCNQLLPEVSQLPHIQANSIVCGTCFARLARHPRKQT
jgi:hypothetical protein